MGLNRDSISILKWCLPRPAAMALAIFNSPQLFSRCDYPECRKQLQLSSNEPPRRCNACQSTFYYNRVRKTADSSRHSLLCVTKTAGTLGPTTTSGSQPNGSALDPAPSRSSTWKAYGISRTSAWKCAWVWFSRHPGGYSRICIPFSYILFFSEIHDSLLELPYIF